MRLANGLKLRIEPFEWRADDAEAELAPTDAPGREIAAALRRYALPTGVADAPTFHELVERWRRVHAPEIPLSLLVAFSAIESQGFQDVTNGTAKHGYADTEAFELGVFQVPTGLHGHCTGRNLCEFKPPGPDPHGNWPWRKLCKRFGYDPERWQDPTAQVRVGIANLEQDAARIRGLYPELFTSPGSDWDLCAAVLLPFVGIGTAHKHLARHRTALRALPEAARWAVVASGLPAAYRDNVERKVRLHRALAQKLGSNVTPLPAASAAPIPSVAAQQSAEGSFVPVAVEVPGGGRIRNKADPSPADLVPVLGAGGRPIRLHRLAAQALAALQAAAWKDGVSRSTLLPTSGYRSSDYQARLFKAAQAKHGAQASTWTAPPGHSAHQSGRAVDLSLGVTLDSAHVVQQRATPAYRWLTRHAAEFGFYPYPVEPWHWEYNPPAASQPSREYEVALRAQASGQDWGGTTHYAEIRLGGEGQAAPKTGVFIPHGHGATRSVDLILYLHGYKYRATPRGLVFDPHMTAAEYWDAATNPRVPLREGLAASGKRAILVLPTLGERSEPGRLVNRGGLDAYLDQVRGFLGTLPTFRDAGAPALGQLVIAAHSGAGVAMRRNALGSDRSLGVLQECWGYDCFYAASADEEGWVRWARANPGKKLFGYHATSSPRRTALRIARHRLPNLVLVKSGTSHFGAVTEHWRERIEGSAFLSAI